MATKLPPLPKELRSVGSSTEEATRRVDEWARALQQLVAGLRANNPEVLRRLDELESAPAAVGVSDHGALTGLADDDHTQYLRTDGTRALTGNLSAGSNKITDLAAPINPNDAARLADISGASFGSPVALVVGGANSDGVSGDSAHADHKHALPAFGTSSGTFAEGDHSHTAISGGYFDVFMAEAPASGAHAHDDEFSAGAVSGGWTQWDVAGVYTFTPSTAKCRLEISSTGNGTTRWAGVFRAIPDSEFVVVARMGVQAPTTAAATQRLGIIVADDLATNPSTADFRQNGISNASPLTSGPQQINTGTWSAYNGSVSAQTSGGTGHYPWHRCRVNGTSCSHDVSVDGLSWHFVVTVTLGYAPTHYGLGYNNGSSVAASAWFDLFRVQAGAGSSAFDFYKPGRLSRVLLA